MTARRLPFPIDCRLRGPGRADGESSAQKSHHLMSRVLTCAAVSSSRYFMTRTHLGDAIAIE
jgi:hypothetical protein